MRIEHKEIAGRKCVIIHSDEDGIHITDGTNILVSNDSVEKAEIAFKEALSLAKFVVAVENEVKASFTPPFRIGKHLDRVLLDSTGKVVAKFEDDQKLLAHEVCDSLNRKYLHLS